MLIGVGFDREVFLIYPRGVRRGAFKVDKVKTRSRLKLDNVIRLMSLVSLLCMLCCPIALNAHGETPSQRERVAVLSLQNRIDMSREETSYLTGLVRRVASKQLTQRYLVMTQENIEVLLPPDTKLEDCVSECQVDTGRMIGARFIITGEVLRFGSSLRLTLRMHDTKTGQLMASEVVKANDIEGLESPTERIVEVLVSNIEPRIAAQPKGSKTQSDIDEVIIVGGRAERLPRRQSEPRIPKMKSRRERLRERARIANEALKSRRKRRAQRRTQNVQKKQRTSKERARSRAKMATSNANHLEKITSELYLALGHGGCEIDGVSCEDEGLESDVSLALGLRYYFGDRESAHDWGWKSGIEFKYAHSSLSSIGYSDFGRSGLSYTVNHLNLSYIFAYEAGWLNLSAHVGFGNSSGLYSIFDDRSSESRLLDLDFKDTLNLNHGFSLGIRLTPQWMLSLYTDRFSPTGDVELCDQLSTECIQGKLPEVSQTGLRLSFTI